MVAATKALLEQFIRVYNSGPDEVYTLFGDTVDWSENPSGRGGDRAALFDALKGFRDVFREGHLEVLNMVAGEDQGVLETILTAVNKATSEPLKARVIWVLGFTDGKIIKEHDYSFLI